MLAFQSVNQNLWSGSYLFLDVNLLPSNISVLKRITTYHEAGCIFYFFVLKLVFVAPLGIDPHCIVLCRLQVIEYHRQLLPLNTCPLNVCHASHCCIVVHTNVIQQQNIFFDWMNRPSDDISSRRIIPVQIWELLHTFKQFF